jgi:hypothetical protein
MELKATPDTGLPLRTTSEITATSETVWAEKLTSELAISPCRGTVHSRSSTIFMGPTDSYRVDGASCFFATLLFYDYAIVTVITLNISKGVKNQALAQFMGL